MEDSGSMSATINISTGRAVSGAFVFAATIIGGLWVVLSFSMSETRENVAYIRAAVDANGASDHTVEVSLRQAMSDLTTELRVNNERLENSSGSVAANSEGMASLRLAMSAANEELAGLVQSVVSLTQSMQAIDASLQQAEERQRAFEAFVTLRIGAIPTDGQYQSPPNSTAAQRTIFDELATERESDPLSTWYELYKLPQP